jgi:hypothetical protein
LVRCLTGHALPWQRVVVSLCVFVRRFSDNRPKAISLERGGWGSWMSKKNCRRVDWATCEEQHSTSLGHAWSGANEFVYWFRRQKAGGALNPVQSAIQPNFWGNGEEKREGNSGNWKYRIDSSCCINADPLTTSLTTFLHDHPYTYAV